jgi:bifunctional DNA-binding transcriptional regulator/antitoxin component of YhaV-PrlF toxin-antitoxin module
MYETICILGERGQITIPKTIREIKEMKSKDKIIVKIDEDKIVIEKMLSKKEKEALLIEGYKKTADLSKEVAEDWKYVSAEADRLLDEY